MRLWLDKPGILENRYNTLHCMGMQLITVLYRLCSPSHLCNCTKQTQFCMLKHTRFSISSLQGRAVSSIFYLLRGNISIQTLPFVWSTNTDMLSNEKAYEEQHWAKAEIKKKSEQSSLMKLSSAGPKVDGGEQTEREVNIFTCPVASHAIARSQIFLGVLFSYGKKKITLW